MSATRDSVSPTARCLRPLPLTRMRTAYRLQGLVRRYGVERVQWACSLSLDLDVVSVNHARTRHCHEQSDSNYPVHTRSPSEFQTTQHH